jgi:hypothetical protein
MELAGPRAPVVDQTSEMITQSTQTVGHSMRASVIRYLDQLARPALRWVSHPSRAFKICGYTGLFLGFVQSMVLVELLGLSQLVLLGITAVVILTFHSVVMITKILTGEEQIIYYHHEIAVIAMLAVFLRLLHQPVVRYLDVVILGIGLFLACGRIGCLMVGCCHGRPARWGIRYKHEHVHAGFPKYLAGVRLFPVQAVESLLVLAIVLIGIMLLLRSPLPGEALAWYAVVYGLGRFVLEFLRGDSERPYCWGFSQAQWISSILMAGLLFAEIRGALPFHPWHVAACAALGSAVLVVAISRRLRGVPGHLLFHPRHVSELAEALEFAVSSADRRITTSREQALQVSVACTSLGILVSGSKIQVRNGGLCHYTISCKDGAMTEEAAMRIANLICKLRNLPCDLKLFPGKRGIFHFVVPAA